MKTLLIHVEKNRFTLTFKILKECIKSLRIEFFGIEKSSDTSKIGLLGHFSPKYLQDQKNKQEIKDKQKKEKLVLEIFQVQKEKKEIEEKAEKEVKEMKEKAEKEKKEIEEKAEKEVKEMKEKAEKEKKEAEERIKIGKKTIVKQLIGIVGDIQIMAIYQISKEELDEIKKEIE